MSTEKILCKIRDITDNLRILFIHYNFLEIFDKISENLNNNDYVIFLNSDIIPTKELVNCKCPNNVFYISDNIDIREKKIIETLQSIFDKNNINIKADLWFHDENEHSLLFHDIHLLDFRNNYIILDDMITLITRTVKGQEHHFMRNAWIRGNIPSNSYIDSIISKMIDNKEPFSIIRSRSEDIIIFYRVLNKKINKERIRSGSKPKDRFIISEKEYEMMYYNCGVYPFKDIKMLDFYIEENIKAYQNSDIIAYHAAHRLDVLNILHSNYCKNSMICSYACTCFPNRNNGWLTKLEGKKVLVISSFSDSIRYQYEKLGPATLSLPNFELITYSAVQSIAGNEIDDSWEVSLNKMKN